MSKVLLINPAEFETKYNKAPSLNRMVFPPLGLAYIAAVLEENDHKVNIFDAPPLNADEENLKTYMKKSKPDIVGIQAFTSSVYQAIKAAEISKELYPDIKVVLGGYHPTFMPNETMEMSKNIDFVVRGEGEYIFLNLVNSIEKGDVIKKLKEIKGINFRNNGRVIQNPDAPLIEDIDSLPFPARHLLPLEEYHYFGAKKEMQSLLSSRGCPFKCKFCAISSYYNRTWRPRSAKNVVDEMEHILEKYGIKAIAMMDDMATADKKRIKNICKEINERALDLFWGTVSRVDTVDYETLRAMSNARCLQVMVGMESGCQQILDNSGKGINIEQIKKFFEWCDKLGMDTIASIVFGLPGETKETLLETLKLVIKLNPGVAVFSAATPFPGTPFWEESKKNGLIPDNINWSNFTMYDPVISLTEVDKKELEEFIQFAYLKFRGRPKWGMKRLFNDLRYTQKIHGFLGFVKVPPLTARLFVHWLRNKSMGRTFN